MGFTWTDDPLVAGTTKVKALHWNEPQINLDTLYAAMGLDYSGCSGAAWTLLPVSADAKVQDEEMTQLRQRIDHAYDNFCGTHNSSQNSHHHNNYNISEDNPYHGTHQNGYHPDYHGTHDTGYRGTHRALEYIGEETGYHGTHYSTDKGTDNPDYHSTYHVTHNPSYHPGYCSGDKSGHNPSYHTTLDITYYMLNHGTHQTSKYVTVA